MLKWLINKYWNWRYPEWSDDMVKEYFDKCNNNIWLFQNKLIEHSFKWHSDGLNFSIYTDTFARPNQVLARKFGNCGDYMRLFEVFIKYTKCATRYAQYELTCDDKFNYHYTMIVWLKDGNIITQSNLQLLSEEAFKTISKDYDNVWLIDKWEE